MKTIFLNGKMEKISAAEERVLRYLAANDYTAKVGDFTIGRGRYQNTDLTKDMIMRREGCRLTSVYIRLADKDSDNARIAAFAKNNPRCRHVVTANPRRVNTILRNLGRS